MVNKPIRSSWVYWVTLLVICGQLALWIISYAQFMQSLRPYLAVVSPGELIQAMIEKLGTVRFIYFYVIGLLNIVIYVGVIVLLLLANRRARTFFSISLVVAAVNQLLNAAFTLPGASTRDWVTTMAGNLGLAVFLGLLYLAFRCLFPNPTSDSALISL